MAKKKKFPTKLTTTQKNQLKKLLGIIRHFPRKKKPGINTTGKKSGTGNVSELQGLIQNYKAQKLNYDAATNNSQLFKTAAGIRSWQQTANLFSAAQNAVVEFLLANPTLKTAATNLGYP